MKSFALEIRPSDDAALNRCDPVHGVVSCGFSVNGSN